MTVARKGLKLVASMERMSDFWTVDCLVLKRVETKVEVMAA